MHRYSVSAGTPQRMPWMKAVAPGMISGAMPIGPSACTTAVMKPNSSRPSPAASHSAWRNSAPTSSRRPLPSSCDTAGGNDISVPIGTIIGSQNSAVPTATAASVSVPWWPAITLSTKPISPVDRWPNTSGAASTPVRRTSAPRRGGVGASMAGVGNMQAGAALAPGRGGPLS